MGVITLCVCVRIYYICVRARLDDGRRCRTQLVIGIRTTTVDCCSRCRCAVCPSTNTVDVVGTYVVAVQNIIDL